MENMGQSKYMAEWGDLIGDLVQKGQSAAIGIFNLDGQLLFANPSMCFFLDVNSKYEAAKNLFINPVFSSFSDVKENGLVFEGLMTIGNYTDISFGLIAKVFKETDQIMVFAEVDVPNLFKENNQLSHLNQQVNNLQRQLIKEKKTLQFTLAELKETQQMLIHSEKMNAMGQLVAGVAHELNNPIAFVYSNLFSIEKYVGEVFQSYHEVEGLIDLESSPDLKIRVAKIRQENELDFLSEDISDMVKESKIGIERVKTIVEDLRRFSRLDESAVKTIDLIENIKSTISISRSELTRKSINLEFIAPDHLLVGCYPGQLNQAILNVLINAIYAVDSGGKIVLSVEEDDPNILISIKDNGCGILEEIRDRIFDPFFTTKPVGSGTGLGLSITYKIVSDLHKGSIEVTSGPEMGTIFKLIIPRYLSI
jgi:signal transduction histidine kinase